MLLALSVAGVANCGGDVGGFFGNPDTELLVRWYQAAVFQPFLRGHAHIEAARREPWLFGEPHTTHIRVHACSQSVPCLAALELLFCFVRKRTRLQPAKRCRVLARPRSAVGRRLLLACAQQTHLLRMSSSNLQDALRERYALLPYLYTLFRAANATGAPIMRPLWYEYPDQEWLFAEQRAFMLGPALFSAPVVEQGVESIEVAFPSGDAWYDADSGAEVKATRQGRTQVSVTAASMPRCAISSAAMARCT
jgi:alpha-glucosidase (family GH31 glycosyl hydrolase)